MREEVVLREATFNPKVKTYWLLSGVIVLTLCIITIPLVPIWYFVGLALTERYLNSLSCVLTDRTLKIKRGIFNKVEKTVPLEKITDLGQTQGPIMRWLDIKGMSIETAGQSAAGALVNMIGIVDVDGFRDAVLNQRDRLVAKDTSATSAAAPLAAVGAAANDPAMAEMRDALLRIEKLIEKHVS